MATKEPNRGSVSIGFIIALRDRETGEIKELTTSGDITEEEAKEILEKSRSGGGRGEAREGREAP